jgi:hypothetical protein
VAPSDLSPGLALIEDITTKGADKFLEAGPYGLFALVMLAGVVFAGLVIRHLYNENRARDTRHEATLERVITVAEGYKSASVTMATAVDQLKAVQGTLVQAVADLSREAEGESRETRHSLSNIMQVVAANLDVLRRMDERGKRP